MPMPTDDQAKMMYKMMMFMPIVMGIFLYNYAAGMSLYMIVTSTLGIIEQKVIKKYWPIDDTPPPPKKKSGFMARLMAQAQEQQKRRESEQKKKAPARR
jgi:membrane protein insertase Oxa1/YidC/SpoIIIJ